ncbi:MAG: ankyrin repeat domain-containing protein, partial [Gaiellaceae bacterium]
SPLLRALYEGRNEDVEKLRRPDLDLFEAAALGDASRLRALLDGGAEPSAYAPDGYTPLQLAAFFGHREAAELLIDRGADLTAVSKNEQETYALQAAVAGNHTEIARLLLDAGAPPTARNLASARQNGNEELERLLLERGAES